MVSSSFDRRPWSFDRRSPAIDKLVYDFLFEEDTFSRADVPSSLLFRQALVAHARLAQASWRSGESSVLLRVDLILACLNARNQEKLPVCARRKKMMS